MNQIQLCNYIENLRYARNITQENLVMDICDIRTYKRYRKGTHKIPLQVVIGFSDKLEVNLITLLSDFENAKKEETEKLNNLYNSIANETGETEYYISKINADTIIDPENRLYYDFSMLLYKKEKGSLRLYEYVERLLKLLRFPKIMKKEKLTDIEILVLSSLLDYDGNFDKNEVSLKLEFFIDNQFHNFISKNNLYIAPLILMRLSKHHGILGEYKKVKKYCEMGISLSQKTRNNYLLEYFYYYLSLVYYRKKDQSNFEYCIFQTYNSIYLEGERSKIKKFEKLIYNDFGLQYESFMSKYVSLIT